MGTKKVVEHLPGEFVPHMRRTSGEYYGRLGRATAYKTRFGETLYVGDIVEIICNTAKTIIS